MSRTVRRLFAGALVAASLAAVAPAAQATLTCYRIDMPVGPDQYVCV